MQTVNQSRTFLDPRVDTQSQVAVTQFTDLIADRPDQTTDTRSLFAFLRNVVQRFRSGGRHPFNLRTDLKKVLETYL